MPASKQSIRPEAKEVVPWLAVGVGILYALGWVIQYQGLLRLGVGPLPVVREAAMATSLTFVVWLIPGAGLWLFLSYMYLNPPPGARVRTWVEVVIAALIIYTFLAFLCFQIPLLLGESGPATRAVGWQFHAFECLLVMIAMILRIAQKALVSGLLFLLSGLALLCQAFASIVFPTLPEYLGGLSRAPVRAQLKDPAEVVVGDLVYADDSTVVFSQVMYEPVVGPIGRQVSPEPHVRIPMARVIGIRPVRNRTR